MQVDLLSSFILSEIKQHGVCYFLSLESINTNMCINAFKMFLDIFCIPLVFGLSFTIFEYLDE